MARLRLGLSLLLAAATSAAPAAHAQTTATPAIKIVTLNMLHEWGRSGPSENGLEQRLEMIAAELEALAPDVIGLQEASVSRRSGDVVEWLAKRLGYHHVHAPATERLFGFAPFDWLITRLIGFREGPAILSRFPLAAWEIHDLPRCGTRVFDPRVLLRAELETPWGRMQFYSTHTSALACHHDHIAEIVLQRRGPLPALVTGDFNAAENAPSIARLRAQGFIDTFRVVDPIGDGATVWQRIDSPTPTVRRRVDYIFAVNGSAFTATPQQSRVVLNTPRRISGDRVLWPSDHYGVYAEIALSEQTTGPHARTEPDGTEW